MPVTRSAFRSPKRPAPSLDLPLVAPPAPKKIAQPVGFFHGRAVTNEIIKFEPRTLFFNPVSSLLKEE